MVDTTAQQSTSLVATVKPQVTDTDIVKAILGKNYAQVNTILDSLGVWYHLHTTTLSGQSQPEDMKIGAKFYSISDGKGSVKVYVLRLYEEKMIDKITINFRHDSKEQVEDAMRIRGQTDFHVGTYSTDIWFKGKIKP